MRCLLITFCFLLTAAAPKEPGTFRIFGFAQGTSYQVVYYAQSDIVSKSEVKAIFSAVDSSLSIYNPHSLISQFNRADSAIKMDKHLRKVVERSLEVSQKTNGAFDLTVLPLVQAWGFGTKRMKTPPDAATIASLLDCVGREKLSLYQGYLQKAQPCVKIDVNGIAQGYTVDLLANFLESKGIENYLVEVGGEIRLKGRKQPGGERMAIGIEGPGGSKTKPFPIQKVMRFEEGAVTTSGNYRKYHEYGGQKVSHLINPRTGYPLENEMVSATVWAKDAITADGYDNALMSMGVEAALHFAGQEKDLEAYLIYKKPDGTVADTATSGFYQFLK